MFKFNNFKLSKSEEEIKESGKKRQSLHKS